MYKLSLAQESMLDNKQNTILIYGGDYDRKPYDYPNAPKYLATKKCMKKDPFVKKLNKTIKMLDKFILGRTRKLLQSKSKQSRIVSVVCK